RGVDRDAEAGKRAEVQLDPRSLRMVEGKMMVMAAMILDRRLLRQAITATAEDFGGRFKVLGVDQQVEVNGNAGGGIPIQPLGQDGTLEDDARDGSPGKERQHLGQVVFQPAAPEPFGNASLLHSGHRVGGDGPSLAEDRLVKGPEQIMAFDQVQEPVPAGDLSTEPLKLGLVLRNGGEELDQQTLSASGKLFGKGSHSLQIPCWLVFAMQ